MHRIATVVSSFTEIFRATNPLHSRNRQLFSLLQESVNRSRTSSVSSVDTEASMFSPLSLPPRHYALPSDVDSASEVEDASSVAVGAITKEQLYQSFLKVQRRSEKYKGKFTQVCVF